MSVVNQGCQNYLSGFEDLRQRDSWAQIAKGVAKVASYLFSLGVFPSLAHLVKKFTGWIILRKKRLTYCSLSNKQVIKMAKKSNKNWLLIQNERCSTDYTVYFRLSEKDNFSSCNLHLGYDQNYSFINAFGTSEKGTLKGGDPCKIFSLIAKSHLFKKINVCEDSFYTPNIISTLQHF